MEISASKDRDMTVAAQTDMRTFAAVEWPQLNHKGRIRELCRLLPTWSPRRVRAVYNAETGVSLRANEASDIETMIEDGRNEARDLATLAASLCALLAGPEADFYGPQVAVIRAALLGQRHVAGDGRLGAGPGIEARPSRDGGDE